MRSSWRVRHLVRKPVKLRMLDVRHIEQAVYFFTGFVYAKLRDRAWAVVSGGQAAVPVESEDRRRGGTVLDFAVRIRVAQHEKAIGRAE